MAKCANGVFVHLPHSWNKQLSFLKSKEAQLGAVLLILLIAQLQQQLLTAWLLARVRPLSHLSML